MLYIITGENVHNTFICATRSYSEVKDISYVKSPIRLNKIRKSSKIFGINFSIKKKYFYNLIFELSNFYVSMVINIGIIAENEQAGQQTSGTVENLMHC